MPSVVIITTESLREMQLTHHAIGMPDLPPIVISHPASLIIDAKVKEHIFRIFEQSREVRIGCDVPDLRLDQGPPTRFRSR